MTIERGVGDKNIFERVDRYFGRAGKSGHPGAPLTPQRNMSAGMAKVDMAANV
jgi:hypothetical protein